MRPPRLRCGLFPSMYLPHLLVLPATFGLQRFQPPYPYFPALYVVSVRQVRGLPTASSRFHLTMDTLAVQLCASSLPTRTRDFHPLEPAHGRRTEKSADPHSALFYMIPTAMRQRKASIDASRQAESFRRFAMPSAKTISISSSSRKTRRTRPTPSVL